MRHHTASVVVATAAAIALSGCAAGPAPAPTVTQTVTATVTATPVASPDDPITAMGAWSICAGISSSRLSAADSEQMPYTSDSVTKQQDGSFHVTVGSAPKGRGWGAMVECQISGTVGAPTVVVKGPYDAG